jgi:prolyl oligopeptidase
MQRFPALLAGASWKAEYGDPAVPEDWAYLKAYSPYHNLSAKGKYPRVLFTTSTRDDRVHPGHARKMAARMAAMGHPVLFYENTEGGHAGAADSKQRAHATALVTTFLLTELGN